MIELNVPFTEKDLAKRLGAKWHAQLKKWFITNDMDLQPFYRWISEETMSNIEQQNPQITEINTGTLDKPYSLLLLINKVKNLIVKEYNSSIWLIVEISELKTYNTNLFLTLVEYDEQGNLLARIRGVIWNSSKILKKFIEETNIELKAGIKVLAQVNLDYHLQYGLTVVVNNLDPSYTLGEANAKLLKIKQQLLSDGIFYNNKNLTLPVDFNKIAVISPKDAAGLGDFKQDTLLLENYNLCSFDYYVAIFQGIDTTASITSALSAIIESQINYDAIVIIRGGGASSDLTWLNDYSIAKAICLINIPILSGIGHNKDQTIIDQIAKQSFDTPSKVINFIITSIYSNAEQITADFEYISQYFHKLYTQSSNDLLNLFEYIKNDAIHRIQYIESILDRELLNLQPILQDRLTTLNKLLEAIMQQILSLSPEKALARGFAIAYSNDINRALITSKATANNHKQIVLKFYDGEIEYEKC